MSGELRGDNNAGELGPSVPSSELVIFGLNSNASNVCLFFEKH